MAERERILVAMSGGVDSSVVAALLVRAGHEVVGVTLQLNPCEDRQLGRSCCGIDAVLSARRVADQLGVAHTVMDVRREFQEAVLRPAWDAYREGRTPSPCVLCNQEIKFGLLLRRAERLGCTKVASGHYARIQEGPLGERWLLRASDPAKDQSYFLFALARPQLERLVLPLGGMTKPQVREQARALGLAAAERADSQDACLGSSEEGFAEALRERFEAPAEPGPIVNPSGKEVGRHEGIHRFTVGQRRGLGVSLGARAFVCAVEPQGNRVVVTTDERAIWAQGCEVKLARLADGLTRLPERVAVQIRSRHRAASAQIVEHDGERLRLRFEEAQRAVTPGQAAVFYDGERVLGGGWISRAES